MKANRALNMELRRLVEARLQQTLRGIEDTLNQIIANQETTVKELKEDLKSLEPSFNILLQKWSLEILYTLFLKTATGFGELKKNPRSQLPHPFRQTEDTQTSWLHRARCKHGATPSCKLQTHTKRQEHRSPSPAIAVLLKPALEITVFSEVFYFLEHAVS